VSASASVSVLSSSSTFLSDIPWSSSSSSGFLHLPLPLSPLLRPLRDVRSPRPVERRKEGRAMTT
jgi:hypothetical protein